MSKRQLGATACHSPLANRHFAAEALQNVGDLRVSDMVANQAIQLAATQRNGGACW